MERRRRVAVTVEQCWHRVPGGTASSVLSLLRALDGLPGDDGAAAVDLVGVAARHGAPAPAAWRPTIPVRHLPLPRQLLYETWHALRWPPVEQATGPVDVVHATAVAIPPTRSPLLVTVHDLAFLAEPGHATRHGLRFFRRGTELARRHAALVAVPSQATADECLAAGFEPDRLRVVPWGVAAEPVPDVAVAEARRRHGLDRPYVLFVGTIEPRKNLPAVVEAVAMLDGRGVDLVLVGPDGWNEDLDARLRVLDGTDVRVRRLGFLPLGELGPLYAGAAVFCYPSLREGFGLPVLEAMAQGAPVVTSRGTATEEVAGDAALVVDPRDHAALGAALASILDSPELARDLRDRGRRRAAAYTWTRTAEAYLDLYRELAP